MPLPARAHMTPEEYLAFEAASPTKHEYVRGEIFAMSGVTVWHNDITYNATTALKRQVTPRGCRVQFAEVKLRVERANCFFYPDVFVTCDERDRADPLVQRHASLVVEVLSKSTAEYDRSDKFADYRKLDSLQAYVLVNTDHQYVEVYQRHPTGFWRFDAYEPGQSARIEALDVTLTVADLYAGTEVPAERPPARNDPERGVPD